MVKLVKKKETNEKRYSLPTAARKMGVSARSLYRYVLKDAEQAQEDKLFPAMEKFGMHYHFFSSDIRRFNTKYGKPEERQTRIVVKFGGKKKNE